MSAAPPEDHMRRLADRLRQEPDAPDPIGELLGGSAGRNGRRRADGGRQAGDQAGRDQAGREDSGEQTECPSSWSPVDLAATVEGLLTGTITRPTPTVGHRTDGQSLFYPARVNGLYGPSGAGKSLIAQHVAHQEIAVGNHVVYVDLEDRADSVAGRLLDLGAEPHVIIERFHYINPDEPSGTVAEAELAAIIAEHPVTLVVVDSTGEGLALDGAQPNDDLDVAQWFRRLPAKIADLGPAVAVLDHVVKGPDGGLWPIGSQRKRAAISGAAYMGQAIRGFSTTTAGTVKLTCAKDRNGTYTYGQKVAEAAVDPTGGLTVEIAAPDQPDDGPFRPTALMERVSRWLEGQAEPATQNAIRNAVTGKGAYLDLATDALVAERFVERTRRGQSSAHRSVKPYREADE